MKKTVLESILCVDKDVGGATVKFYVEKPHLIRVWAQWRLVGTQSRILIKYACKLDHLQNQS